MKFVRVRPITLSCMVGFKNNTAQIIIMTRQCVANKNMTLMSQFFEIIRYSVGFFLHLDQALQNLLVFVRVHRRSRPACVLGKYYKVVTVKILKIGTPEIITIIVVQLEQLDFTLQYCV